VINSVFGLGGIFDPATKDKIPFREADFGQTLGSWGLDSGPYLVLPLLGPSDPRDGIGYGVDSVVDPYSLEMQVHGYDDWNYARTGLSIISDQASSMDELDELERNSLDFYAAVRSLYQQRRAAAVRDAGGESGNATPPASIIQQEEPVGPEPSEMPTPSQSGTGKAQ
jgi:phospholipid-binding lipoprotein MlaA